MEALPGYDAWLTNNPADIEQDCPHCGAEIDGDRYSGKCSDPECGFWYDSDDY